MKSNHTKWGVVWGFSGVGDTAEEEEQPLSDDLLAFTVFPIFWTSQTKPAKHYEKHFK